MSRPCLLSWIISWFSVFSFQFSVFRMSLREHGKPKTQNGEGYLTINTVFGYTYSRRHSAGSIRLARYPAASAAIRETSRVATAAAARCQGSSRQTYP